MNPEALAETLQALPTLIRDLERLQGLARGSPTVGARLGLARDSLADALFALEALPEAEPEADRR